MFFSMKKKNRGHVAALHRIVLRRIATGRTVQSSTVQYSTGNQITARIAALRRAIYRCNGTISDSGEIAGESAPSSISGP